MKIRRPTPAAERKAAAAFNARHPVGARVHYWPGTLRGAPLTSATRSEAYLLGGHTAVVLIEGHAGAVALSHVEPADG